MSIISEEQFIFSHYTNFGNSTLIIISILYFSVIVILYRYNVALSIVFESEYSSIVSRSLRNLIVIAVVLVFGLMTESINNRDHITSFIVCICRFVVQAVKNNFFAVSKIMFKCDLITIGISC